MIERSIGHAWRCLWTWRPGRKGTEMDPSEILNALEKYQEELPHEALEAAINDPEAITPGLLMALKYTIQELETLANDPDYMAYKYAMYLLAQFREQRAYPLFIELMSGPPDLVDRLFGDELTDDGARMLASVSGGDIEPIKTLIESPDVYDYVRSAALDALVILVAQGARSREEILAYFGSLFREKLPRTEDFVWGALVTASLELYPDMLYADIQQVFADDLIDPFDCDLEYVDIVMGARQRRGSGGVAVQPS